MIAFAIAASFFWGVPYLAQQYWPAVIAWKESHELSYTCFFLTWVLAQHNLIHLICHLVYWVYYRYEFPCIERYKTNYDEPWPWHANPEKWRSQVKWALAVFLVNSNFIPILVIVPLSRTSAHTEHTMAVDQLPTPATLALTIAFCMMCEDATFYWSHRMLHHPRLYPWIHKMHHTFNQTVSIAAEYSHPLEFLFGNLLPTAIGPAILGSNMHVVTVFAWYMVRVGETLDGHCGYDFSFSPYRLIPMSGSAEYHDFHHSQNVGNYASFFSVWDTVFGTNKAFY